ncbi:EVE domain-containing protein [Deinococcus sp. Marseille-Q6407]|uniref:EVE domain-containing protein n=1 Tax=Deinococcus sp. Marseille-Q6407 TaxID=2969223 RepID=UPI0021BE1E08|nr:EVE domain-containing protein [Deinococcus sp. Marseille-Q6407]
MAYWLIKSEPDVFSFADLQAARREPWNGIRNYQARNFLRQMRRGDLCLFYHSNARPPGVVGVARVVGEAAPDDLQFDPASEYYDPKSSAEAPRWSMVDIEPAAELPQPVTLDRLREMTAWKDSPLVRPGNRLSVLPVSETEFQAALAAGGPAALPDQKPAMR